MIVFNLNCQTCDLSFEGWFADSREYESQKKKKLIMCPSCNSNNISKSLNAPNVSKKTNSKENKTKKAIASDIKKLKNMVEKNFDYLGDKFSEEAKKIKYGESIDRPIYGEATLEQTKELIEEEIDITPLPFSTKKSN
ncbi:DUF1178 family protein [Pelagibacteraceae bacterium]|nr:DUF1178 family protein [Pelagibacteraceae bacterium]